MNGRSDRVIWVCLLGIVIAYVPFVSGGFLTDDFAHLGRLRSLASLRDILLAPDTFGFYRPITQASLALDLVLFDGSGTAYRLTNLILHAGVLAGAFVVARQVLASPIAAGATAIAFALTPKAHPIAVLWISARGELLMALFSLAAVTCWIRWTRSGGGRYLAAAGLCYVLALLSKETAILLPALLLLSPAASIPAGRRLRAVAGIAALAVAALWWRSQVGARLPLSADPHYTFTVPLLARNVSNYTGRLLPAPAALALVVAVAALRNRRRSELDAVNWPAIWFAVTWIVVFLAPVLPFMPRSELYLYLPTFGGCLLVAAVAKPWLDRLAADRRSQAAAVAAAVVLAGFQVSRSAALHADLVFSERLVAALNDMRPREALPGPMALVPGDEYTGRFLQDAIGGYAHVVVQLTGQPAATGTLRCTYEDGRVVLEPIE